MPLKSETVALALALCVPACSDTSVGRNAILPERSSDEIGWYLEDDLRIGRADGDGPDQFGRIGAVTTDPAGNILVLDLIAQEIRVFNASGGFLRIIGRKGGGPGEFTGATGMTVGPGDTLWVIDPYLDRYSAFSPQGQFLASRPRRISGYIDSWPGMFLRDGRYIDWGFALPDETGAFQGARVVLQPILLSPGFQQRDTLSGIHFDQEVARIGTVMRPVPFFNQGVVVAADESGIYFAHTREYRIYRRSFEDDTAPVFSLPDVAAPVGEADREYVRRRMAARPALLTDYLEALPADRPLLHRLIPDGAGNIFVIPDVAGVEPGTIVDAFSVGGQYQGRMQLPETVALFPPPALVAHATPEHLFFAIVDETGAPQVVRLRIVK